MPRVFTLLSTRLSEPTSLRQRLHLAEAAVHLLEPLGDLRKLSPRRCSSVACSFSSTVARICSSFFSLSAWIAPSLRLDRRRTSPMRWSLAATARAAARQRVGEALQRAACARRCARASVERLARAAPARPAQRRWRSESARCCWVAASWRRKLSICSFCVRATSPCCASSVCWNVAERLRELLARALRAARDLVAQLALEPLESPRIAAAAVAQRESSRCAAARARGSARRTSQQRGVSQSKGIRDCRSGERAAARRRRVSAAGRAEPALGEVERRLHEQRERRRRQRAGEHRRALSLTARPATMRSPKPPAPMNAAIVAVPTLITAAVLTPASSVGSASGSCTWRSAWRARQAERQRRLRHAAATRRAGRRGCCARSAAARRGTARSPPARRRCAPTSAIRNASSASDGTVCSTRDGAEQRRRARAASARRRCRAARRRRRRARASRRRAAGARRARRPKSGAKTRSTKPGSRAPRRAAPRAAAPPPQRGTLRATSAKLRPSSSTSRVHRDHRRRVDRAGEPRQRRASTPARISSTASYFGKKPRSSSSTRRPRRPSLASVE